MQHFPKHQIMTDSELSDKVQLSSGGIYSIGTSLEEIN
jgi:hypothetical protein